jgi:opacity protein-like surface antigen
MKKLILSLVLTTVAVTPVSAECMGTGFYLGGNLGMGNAATRVSGQYNAPTISGQYDNDAGNIGFHFGYGHIMSCWYLGAEAFYSFERLVIRNTLGGAGGAVDLRRNGHYGLAIRGGYMFTPSTLFYIRFGTHLGRWILTDSANFPAPNQARASRNSLNFSPGVGMETAVYKNITLRGEWFYESGPNLTVANAVVAPVATNWTNAGKLRYNTYRLGVSYKF